MAKRIIITCDHCGKIVYDKTRSMDIYGQLLHINKKTIPFNVMGSECVCNDCTARKNTRKPVQDLRIPVSPSLEDIFKRFKADQKDNTMMQEFGAVTVIQSCGAVLNAPNIERAFVLINDNSQRVIYDLTNWFDPQFYYVDDNGIPIDPPKKDCVQRIMHLSIDSVLKTTDYPMGWNVRITYFDTDNLQYDHEKDFKICFDNWSCRGAIKLWLPAAKDGDTIFVTDSESKVLYIITKSKKNNMN